MEQLNTPLFSMAENILIAVGAHGTDLIKSFFGHLVKREGFKFNDDSFEDDYELVHQISDNIEVFRRAAFRLLSVRISYDKRHVDLTKTTYHELDNDVDSGMMAGITDEDKL